MILQRLTQNGRLFNAKLIQVRIPLVWTRLLRTSYQLEIFAIRFRNKQGNFIPTWHALAPSDLFAFSNTNRQFQPISACLGVTAHPLNS